jgi:DinB superfamily
MQPKEYIEFQLDFLRKSLSTITDGLTAEEMSWRPGEANSIGFLMLHIARSEDLNILTRFQGKPQVWVSGKWYEKFKLGENETTFGWTKEKLETFVFPGSKEMLAYADAVRAETKKYMEKLTPSELERVIHNEYLGDLPIGKLFARMVIHFSGHIGEMSYIRGLKRGLNK